MTPEHFENARIAQRHLLDMIKTLQGVRGVGIGVTCSRDAYALEVLVDADHPPEDIPTSVDGVPVVLKPVGEIVAA